MNQCCWRRYVVTVLGVALFWASESSGADGTVEESYNTKMDNKNIIFEQQRQQKNNIRWLEEETSYGYDMSDYSIRFGKCQFVKTYDDEIAEDEESSSVFATKQFIVYRMCPTDSCSNKCDGSDQQSYGEYVVELEDYLEFTIQNERKNFEYICENCNENYNYNNENYEDSDGTSSSCGKMCYLYDNLENNGYVDASEYIDCQQLEDGGDDDNDNGLFIGPRCSHDGTHIVIGLFSDENCWEPYYDEDPEDILGMKFSYHLLSNIYANDVCLSCEDNEDQEQNNNENQNNNVDDVNEMCEMLYDNSAKCEYHHGITNGFIQVNNRDENNNNENEYNQIENEFMVCDFIDTLVFNSYTETGEINVLTENDEIIRVNTNLQITMVVLLSITVVVLFVYAALLHRQIALTNPVNNNNNNNNTSPSSRQGGDNNEGGFT